MTDPKGEKPESDHPHGGDSSLELHHDEEGLPVADGEQPLDVPAVNASTEEFHFSGPVEELDFSEPTDFTFPSEQPGGAEGVEHSCEFVAAEPAEAEQGFLAGEGISAESPFPEEAAVDTELAGEGIADLEIAEEPAEVGKKPKFELPAWVRTAEWITVSVLAAGALIAVISSIIWVQAPGRVTLIMNIAFPVMLALIPYALWRSIARWVTPPASALYTVMLALSTAALIGGTWFEGLELSHYRWQFSKTRVRAGKPPAVVMVAPAQPAPAEKAPQPATK